MKSMIDIHSHILPGVDDGASGLTESLNMARSAAQSGISVIAAVPHYIAGVYINERKAVISAVDKLNKIIQEKNIPINVLPGTEAYIDIALPSMVKNGQLLTINDAKKYLLIEFPMSDIPVYSERVIFELMLNGITPIIAHPERNAAVLRNPQLLYYFLCKGVLVQLTAASLEGLFGKAIKDLSTNFLKLGWVHLIGTDSHSSKGGRRPVLLPVTRTLEKLVGRDMTRTLVCENPRKVLLGEPIDVGSYKKYIQKGVLKKLGFMFR